jgi:hypothetical protein
MDFSVAFFAAVVVLAGVFQAAFQQYLRQQRRQLIHRERLTALEKGIDLPPVEQEIQRRSWNVQRILVLAGLTWVSLGLGVYLVLSSLVGQTFHVLWGTDRFGNPMWVPVLIRDGMQWSGVALFGIGVSHLVVYAMGRRGRS